MFGRTPGSPRHPSSRHPRPSDNLRFPAVALESLWFSAEICFSMVSYAPQMLEFPGRVLNLQTHLQFSATLCVLGPASHITQWARRDILMSRDQNCRETISVSQLSRSCPHCGGHFERGKRCPLLWARERVWEAF